MSEENLSGREITLVQAISGRYKYIFRVGEQFSRGASVVCYRAELNGRSGILREFWPEDGENRHFVLHRDDKGFLHTGGELSAADELFRRSRDQYAEAYTRLRQDEALKEDVLKTFIPDDFELYYGEDYDPDAPERYDGTVFVWSTRMLYTFQDICEEIRRQPSARPDFFLFNVLHAVKLLAESVYWLHCAGYLHRDIKPSNFGFVRRGDEVLTQTLTLFDVDSLWNLNDPLTNIVGSPGYMAPEAEAGKEPDNRSDIYSIGATLFSAIVLTDESKQGDYLYQAGYYDRLQDMVDASELIRSSEHNSHPRLRELLGKILSSCLNSDPDERYSGCSDLIRDLKSALSYVMPEEMAQRNRAGERWVLTDAESAFDRRRRKNFESVFRYHLYAHPVYNWTEKDSPDIRVLVLGLGNYGQRFLDNILSLGQVPDRRLSVTTASDDPSDLQLYLQSRPALKDFLSVMGSEPQRDCGDYGRIEYREIKNVDKASLGRLFRSTQAQYVFIALGNEQVNLTAANLIAEVRDSVGARAAVSFVWGDKSCDSALPEDVFPVLVNTAAGLPGSGNGEDAYRQLDRMAFNLYSLWNRSSGESRQSRLEKFRADEYEYDSCAAHALSLRYMLQAVGLDVSQSEQKIAEAFRSLTKGSSGSWLIEKLSHAEHRRWTVQKLCDGWSRLEELPADNSTKKDKRHLCLVGSRQESALYGAGVYLWDLAPEEDIEALDGLDRLSVHVHRHCVQEAEAVRARAAESGESIPDGSTVSSVLKNIGENGEAASRFYELRSCIQDLVMGDRTRAGLYDALYRAFIGAAKKLPESRCEQVLRLAEQIHRELIPIRESLRYRDFKYDDRKLVEDIPYLLTYTPPAAAIPFSFGTGTAVLANIASAAETEPEDIFYLCRIRDDQAGELLETLPNVLRLLRKRSLYPKLHLLIAYSCLGSTGWKERLAAVIEGMDAAMAGTGFGWQTEVRMLYIDEEAELSEAFADVLSEYELPMLFAEKNDSPLSVILQDQGFYEKRSWYCFDMHGREFVGTHDTKWLNYVHGSDYITAGDYIAIGRETGSIEPQPRYIDDYRDLWARYSDAPAVWVGLCEKLAAAARTNDTAAVLPHTDSVLTEPYHYILPSECLPAARKLLRQFEQSGLASDGTVCSRDTQDGEITFTASFGLRKKMDDLFAEPIILLQPEGISFETDENGSLRVLFDHRKMKGITGLSVPERELLEYFHKKGYIIRLSGTGTLTFTSATRETKRLLTDPQRILQIYVYRRLKEAAVFDDVRAGVILHSIGSERDDTLDIVVTRGYRSAILSFVPAGGLTAQTRSELCELARQVGINARAVAVMDDSTQNMTEENCDDDLYTVIGMNAITKIVETMRIVLPENPKAENEIQSYPRP